jgi:hypothetical protein
VKQVLGVASVRKVSANDNPSQRQDIRVIERDGVIVLDLSECNYPAGLTAEQARHLAWCLTVIADRVDTSTSAAASDRGDLP